MWVSIFTLIFQFSLWNPSQELFQALVKKRDHCKGVFSKVNEQSKMSSTNYCPSKAFRLCFYLLIYSDRGPCTVFALSPGHRPPQHYLTLPHSQESLRESLTIFKQISHQWYTAMTLPHRTAQVKKAQLQKHAWYRNFPWRFWLKIIFKTALYFTCLGPLTITEIAFHPKQ